MTETAFAKEVEAVGLVSRGIIGEWLEQSCGAAPIVNLPAVSSTTCRWHESPAGVGATASTFDSTGRHSNPQANIDSGDARSAIMSASAAEVGSRIALFNVTQHHQKAFTMPTWSTRAESSWRLASERQTGSFNSACTVKEPNAAASEGATVIQSPPPTSTGVPSKTS